MSPSEPCIKLSLENLYLRCSIRVESLKFSFMVGLENVKFLSLSHLQRIKFRCQRFILLRQISKALRLRNAFLKRREEPARVFALKHPVQDEAELIGDPKLREAYIELKKWGQEREAARKRRSQSS